MKVFFLEFFTSEELVKYWVPICGQITLLDDNFNFFQEILKKKLWPFEINKCTVSNKNAQARFFSKKE